METVEILELIANGVLAAAAVTGAFVAVRGLSTWREQLRGHEEYGLARRILVNTYKLREAFRRVRSPAMWSNEMPAPPEHEAAKMGAEEIRFWSISTAYQNRWAGVVEVKESLSADLLEAEAVWGTDLKAKFEKVFSLEKELWFSIYTYLHSIDPRTSEKMRQAYDKILSKEREILYGSPKTDAGDEFAADMNAAMKPIEAYLKPKLHTSPHNKSVQPTARSSRGG